MHSPGYTLISASVRSLTGPSVHAWLDIRRESALVSPSKPPLYDPTFSPPEQSIPHCTAMIVDWVQSLLHSAKERSTSSTGLHDL